MGARGRFSDADTVATVSRAGAGLPAPASPPAPKPPAGWPWRRRCRAPPNHRRAWGGRPSRPAAALCQRLCAAGSKAKRPLAEGVRPSAPG